MSGSDKPKEEDYKAKYESLKRDFVTFIDMVDTAGFQVQGFAKNKKAELLGQPAQPQQPIIPRNRAERRAVQRKENKS